MLLVARGSEETITGHSKGNLCSPMLKLGEAHKRTCTGWLRSTPPILLPQAIEAFGIRPGGNQVESRRLAQIDPV